MKGFCRFSKAIGGCSGRRGLRGVNGVRVGFQADHETLCGRHLHAGLGMGILAFKMLRFIGRNGVRILGFMGLRVQGLGIQSYGLEFAPEGLRIRVWALSVTGVPRSC